MSSSSTVDPSMVDVDALMVNTPSREWQLRAGEHRNGGEKRDTETGYEGWAGGERWLSRTEDQMRQDGII